MADVKITSLPELKKWFDEHVLAGVPDGAEKSEARKKVEAFGAQLEQYYSEKKEVILKDGKLNLDDLKAWAATKGDVSVKALEGVSGELKRVGAIAAEKSKSFFDDVIDFVKDHMGGLGGGIAGFLIGSEVLGLPTWLAGLLSVGVAAGLDYFVDGDKGLLKPMISPKAPGGGDKDKEKLNAVGIVKGADGKVVDNKLEMQLNFVETNPVVKMSFDGERGADGKITVKQVLLQPPAGPDGKLPSSVPVVLDKAIEIPASFFKTVQEGGKDILKLDEKKISPDGTGPTPEWTKIQDALIQEAQKFKEQEAYKHHTYATNVNVQPYLTPERAADLIGMDMKLDSKGDARTIPSTKPVNRNAAAHIG